MSSAVSSSPASGSVSRPLTFSSTTSRMARRGAGPYPRRWWSSLCNSSFPSLGYSSCLQSNYTFAITKSQPLSRLTACIFCITIKHRYWSYTENYMSTSTEPKKMGRPVGRDYPIVKQVRLGTAHAADLALLVDRWGCTESEAFGAPCGRRHKKYKKRSPRSPSTRSRNTGGPHAPVPRGGGGAARGDGCRGWPGGRSGAACRAERQARRRFRGVASPLPLEESGTRARFRDGSSGIAAPHSERR
jgi:hypothetical protein